MKISSENGVVSRNTLYYYFYYYYASGMGVNINIPIPALLRYQFFEFCTDFPNTRLGFDEGKVGR